MDIARKAGLWGSTDSDKKSSASHVLKNLEESLAHGSYKCSADRNCPLQLALQKMVPFGDLDLRRASVATLGDKGNDLNFPVSWSEAIHNLPAIKHNHQHLFRDDLGKTPDPACCDTPP
jgi:hypothetical protein